MVLQANKPIRIFGKANGDVKIYFAGNKFETQSTAGKWEIVLPSMSYGGPYEMLICADGEEKRIRDVMVGEVLLCAGQSNMQFTLAGEESYDKTENTALRIFVCERIEAYEGIKNKDGWVCCEPNTVKYWTALGYHLASMLYKARGVAVGIIGCYQGASNIQTWLPNEIALEERFYVDPLQAHPDYRFELYKKWNQPGKLFEYAFLPIVPYSVSQVVWYQGESNTSLVESKIYKDMLVELVSAWRTALKDERLPFIIVQICDFDERDDEAWHAIQLAQKDAVEDIKYAKLVTTSDVCEHFDIHPQHKEKVAEKILKSL
jgi:sialate O-acetylesterase